MSGILTEVQWRQLITAGIWPELTAQQWEEISGWELFGVYFVDSLVDKLIYIAQRAADGMPMMGNVVAYGRQLTADVRARHTVQSLMAKAKEKVYAAAIESKGKLMEILSKVKPGTMEVAQRTKHYVGDVVKPLMKEWDHTKNLQKNLDQIVRKIQLRPESWTRDQLVVAIDHAAKEIGYQRWMKQHPLFKPYPKYVKASEIWTAEKFEQAVVHRQPLKWHKFIKNDVEEEWGEPKYIRDGNDIYKVEDWVNKHKGNLYYLDEDGVNHVGQYKHINPMKVRYDKIDDWDKIVAIKDPDVMMKEMSRKWNWGKRLRTQEHPEGIEMDAKLQAEWSAIKKKYDVPDDDWVMNWSEDILYEDFHSLIPKRPESVADSIPATSMSSETSSIEAGPSGLQQQGTRSKTSSNSSLSWESLMTNSSDDLLDSAQLMRTIGLPETSFNQEKGKQPASSAKKARYDFDDPNTDDIQVQTLRRRKINPQHTILTIEEGTNLLANDTYMRAPGDKTLLKKAYDKTMQLKEKVKDWLSSRPAIIQRTQNVPHMYNAMVQRIIQWTAYMQFHYTGIRVATWVSEQEWTQIINDMREVLGEDFTDLEGVAKAVFPPEQPTKDPYQEQRDKERELALQKEATTARVNEAMKQMKQSKQYAKFTEINKRRWHNKIRDTVKEWIYVQDHRRDMSYFDTLVARSTLAGTKIEDDWKKWIDEYGKIMRLSEQELQQLHQETINGITKLRYTAKYNKEIRQRPNVERPRTPLAQEIFESDDEDILEMLSNTEPLNIQLERAIERSETPQSFGSLLEALGEPGSTIEEIETSIQEALATSTPNKRPADTADTSAEGILEEPPTSRQRLNLTDEESAESANTSQVGVAEGVTNQGQPEVSHDRSDLARRLNLTIQEVSYILNNDGTAYGRSRNAKLKRIRYKPMIQYIGGWKFIPEGMNPWLQKEETDLEDPNL